ncbi:hypothetical protein [Pectobacterium versatile]|uniref:hypothetical protein n=1 Tax=Pectobacterium versatile TaxID=2488639 RepID=UPI00301AC539
MEASFYLYQLQYSKTLYDNLGNSKGIEKGYKRKTRKARTGAGFIGNMITGGTEIIGALKTNIWPSSG